MVWKAAQRRGGRCLSTTPTIPAGPLKAPLELYAKTGVLNRTPDLLRKDDMIISAHARARKVKIPASYKFAKSKKAVVASKRKIMSRKEATNLTVKNPTRVIASIAWKKYEVFVEALTRPLERCIPLIPTLSMLHPFERALVDLTLDKGCKGYVESVRALKKLNRTIIDRKNKDHREWNAISNSIDVLAWYNKSTARMEALVDEKGVAVDIFRADLKALFNLAVLNPLLPTIALVGMPNVGKSSIVKEISSGDPEIKNYAFTTRGIIVGHIVLPGRVKGRNMVQVTDTPGVLQREHERRNKMERLTLAVLENFPLVTVVFVLDPANNPGASVEQQHILRRELKQRHPRHPWVDVVSKSDMLPEDMSEVMAGYESPGEVMRTSCVTGDGLGELKAKLEEHAGDHMDDQFFDAMDLQMELEAQQEAGLVEPANRFSYGGTTVTAPAAAEDDPLVVEEPVTNKEDLMDWLSQKSPGGPKKSR